MNRRGVKATKVQGKIPFSSPHPSSFENTQKKCIGSYKKNRNIQIRLTLRPGWTFDPLLKFSSLLVAVTKDHFLWRNGFFFTQAFHFSWMRNCFSSTEIISGNFTLLQISKMSLLRYLFSGHWELKWKIFIFIFQPSRGLCTISAPLDPWSPTKFPGTFFPVFLAAEPIFSASALPCCGQLGRNSCLSGMLIPPSWSQGIPPTLVTMIHLSRELQWK